MTSLSRLERALTDACVIHGIGVGSWALFELFGRRFERFRGALDGFEATYQFRAGSACRRLVFADGHVTTRRGAVAAPEYELELLDPVAVVRCVAADPNDVLRLLMENRIEQRGNNYYLFQLGYLMGLCQHLWGTVWVPRAPAPSRQRKA
jgi:hypothetical protein